MNSGDLVKAILAADPSGKMDVWLAADTGEGYVPMETVFVDRLDRQQVDGDEISGSRRETVLFIGDNNASKSPDPIFRYELDPRSKEEFDDEDGDHFDDAFLIMPFSAIRDKFSKLLGVEVTGLNTTLLKIFTDDTETRLVVQTELYGRLPKYISRQVAEETLMECLLQEKRLTGHDRFDHTIHIVKIE